MSTTKFYSSEFEKINKDAHHKYQQYGSVTGYVFYFDGHNLPINSTSVLSIIKTFGPKTVLDYGCGKGLGADNMVYNYPDLSVTKYDPFVKEFSQQPSGKFDLVICYNVLQIVETDYIHNVLDHLFELTEKNLLINILVNQKIRRNLDWWRRQLNRFEIFNHGTSQSKLVHGIDGETFESINASYWIKK